MCPNPSSAIREARARWGDLYHVRFNDPPAAGWESRCEIGHDVFRRGGRGGYHRAFVVEGCGETWREALAQLRQGRLPI